MAHEVSSLNATREANSQRTERLRSAGLDLSSLDHLAFAVPVHYLPHQHMCTDDLDRGRHRRLAATPPARANDYRGLDLPIRNPLSLDQRGHLAMGLEECVALDHRLWRLGCGRLVRRPTAEPWLPRRLLRLVDRLGCDRLPLQQRGGQTYGLGRRSLERRDQDVTRLCLSVWGPQGTNAGWPALARTPRCKTVITGCGEAAV